MLRSLALFQFVGVWNIGCSVSRVVVFPRAFFWPIEGGVWGVFWNGLRVWGRKWAFTGVQSFCTCPSFVRECVAIYRPMFRPAERACFAPVFHGVAWSRPGLSAILLFLL